ncbi:MAG: FAD-dependent oxidoreductase [Chloroflexi bacterium]|nr:FAD-dependent oxidoreductase [Chloroflexota bacterium]
MIGNWQWVMAFNGTSDVIIIGGGIVGCAAAYYLAKRGANVTLLERGGVGSGASGRSGGGVRQSARVSAEIPLAAESVALFPTLSDELGVDIEYVRRGNLRLVESVDHIRPMQVDIKRQQALGLDVQWLGQAEVCEMVPSLQRESVLGASFCPTDGHANPLKLTTGFASAARRAGAQFVTGCEVRSVRQADSGEAVLETSRGDFRAKTVIVAAGAGAQKLCLSMGFDLPLANMRYESLITEAVPPLFSQMFGVAAADLFFRQTQHGSVHFGGGLVQQSESEATTPPSACENLQLAAEHIVRLIPQLGRANLVRTWGGLDPSTPDGIPIIDRLDENVLVAAGFCGHGFAIGPVVGRRLAEWIANGEKPQTLAPFKRSRFDSWLQTKWTPTGSFEAVLATEATQVADSGNGATGDGWRVTASRDTRHPSPEEAAGPKIIVVDPSKCTGCRMCEMACSIHHTHTARQTQVRIKVAYASDDFYMPIACIHCEEAYCMEACVFEALVRDGPNAVIRVVDENCTACMLCVDACPYGGITYSEEKDAVIKCDLCGGDPACAAYCAPGAIRFRAVAEAEWERMKANAMDNVGKLGQGLK